MTQPTRPPIARLLRLALLLAAPTLMGTLACHDLSGLAGTQALPSGTPDPSVYHTAAGALSLYQSTLALAQGYSGDGLGGAFVDFALHAGLLADELQAGGESNAIQNGGQTQSQNVDSRQLPEGVSNPTDALYGELQAVRGSAQEAIGALLAYDDSAPPALRGQLYALQGYADLYLADLYCSGVPLSTLNFNSSTSYTYAAGSTTPQLYLNAIAQFDTALALSGDSVRIVNLARVGAGRAWLALDSLQRAANAVAAVPNGFSYTNQVDWTAGSCCNLFNNSISGLIVTVADDKGGNGLPFLSSNDPRTASQENDQIGFPILIPDKYGGAMPTDSPYVVADWIEARLIQAEAALNGVPTGQGSWLDQLNALRATAPIPGTAQANPDALPPLSDPGTDTGRVSLVFQERAYWLFLTGHRQGDLRRLVREYHRQPSQVYPSGLYPESETTIFYNSSFLTAPVPTAESVNTLYHGCLSRGA